MSKKKIVSPQVYKFRLFLDSQSPNLPKAVSTQNSAVRTLIMFIITSQLTFNINGVALRLMILFTCTKTFGDCQS